MYEALDFVLLCTYGYAISILLYHVSNQILIFKKNTYMDRNNNKPIRWPLRLHRRYIFQEPLKAPLQFALWTLNYMHIKTNRHAYGNVCASATSAVGLPGHARMLPAHPVMLGTRGRVEVRQFGRGLVAVWRLPLRQCSSGGRRVKVSPWGLATLTHCSPVFVLKCEWCKRHDDMPRSSPGDVHDHDLGHSVHYLCLLVQAGSGMLLSVC